MMKVPLLPKTKKLISRRTSSARIIPDLPIHWPDFVRRLKIKSEGGEVVFDPYDYQIKIIEAIERVQNTVICKSRQMGVSELVCSYLLKRALREPGFTAVVFSKSQPDSSKLAKRIKFMAKSLGSDCPPFSSENQNELVWEGLGELIFLAPTERAGRSVASVSVIFYDEGAHIFKFEELYGASAPTSVMLGDKRKIITCSTPNGRQGLYWNLLSNEGKDAGRVEAAAKRVTDRNLPGLEIWEEGKDAKIFLHYHEHPIYGPDLDWPEKTRKEYKFTEARWRQEFELDFHESGSLVFDTEAVDRCATGILLPALPGRSYLAGTDPSFGGGDAFVTQVWDITERPYSLVASYSASHKSNDANLANTMRLYYEYRPAAAGIETNGGGALILQELTKTCSWLRIEGVHTTGTSKLINTDRLSLMLEREGLQFPPACGFHQECRHFIERQSGRSRVREAESGHHDDEVMAAAVAFACLDLATDANWLEKLLS